MKNSKKSLWPMAFIIAFSLYLFAVPVAMAAPKDTVSQNTIRDEKSSISQNTTQGIKSSISQNTIQDVKSSVSQNTIEDVTADDDRKAEPDTVSTADEFTAWMESHKNSGGNVKLTNNIVLKEFYDFTPNAAGLPDIIVDTDIYTITAAGNITFFSDGHLIFRGKTSGKGIFHVIKGGVLTLDGVIVEGTAQGGSMQYALWQEEGAGLLLGNTVAPYRVTGKIHYADTPFAKEPSSSCVVVEKGQSVDGLFPTQVKCTVNYQGQLRYKELVPVSWDLTGTEEQQEKRQRFRVQGFSSQAAFETPPVCTVVYNDYPLTFTEVAFFMRGAVYYFQGNYTKPQGTLPLVVTEEYSFDGTDWIEHEKRTVSSDEEGFYIYFHRTQWDQEQNPYVYIRLRAEKNGKTYLSNVLRYKAGSMDVAEDIGGSRGGGTAIVNPSDEPKDEDSNNTSSGNQKPSGSQKPADDHKPSQDSHSQRTESEEYKDNAPEASGDSTDIDANSESGNSDVNQAAGQNTPPIAEDLLNGENTTAHTTPDLKESKDKSKGSSSVIANTDESNDSGADGADEETVAKGTVEVMSKELAAPASDGDDADVGKHRQMAINQRLNTTKNIILVLGFVTLSAGAGVVGYFIHTSSLRRHGRRKSASPKGKNKKTR